MSNLVELAVAEGEKPPGRGGDPVAENASRGQHLRAGVPCAFKMVVIPALGRRGLSVHGELDVDSGRRLAQAVQEVSRASESSADERLVLVLDLTDVTFVDSWGAQALSDIAAHVSARNGELHIIRPAANRPRQLLRCAEDAGWLPPRLAWADNAARPALADHVRRAGDPPAQPSALAIRQRVAITTWESTLGPELEALVRAAPAPAPDRTDAVRCSLIAARLREAVVRYSTDSAVAPTLPGGRPARLRAVIAHRQPWFATKLTEALSDLGVCVLAAVEHGDEALGAVIALQPDVLFAQDALALLSGPAVIAAAGLMSPRTVSAGQARDANGARDLRAGGAKAVFLRDVPPGEAATAIIRLFRMSPSPEPALAPVDPGAFISARREPDAAFLSGASDPSLNGSPWAELARTVSEVFDP